ncbi:MAG: hypothetical protein FWH11_11405 [Micrococcales bacterium]|nr:hypothetical protein [Micrococcales bacterium]
MRTPTPWRAVTLCALAVLALTAGCTDEGADAEASASAFYATQEAAQEAAAVQEAEQAVRDYYQVRYQCFADPPNTDPSCFDAVAVDQQLLDDRAALEWVQDIGGRTVGAIEVVGTERVVDVQLLPGTKEIALSVCIDATGLDTLGSDGTSIVSDGDALRGRDLYIVRKHVDRWQVAGILDDPEGETCG